MSDEIEKEPPAGLPAWVMTFADLMSLLMCFFVLLLSFSEMDLQKFKQVAGSMEKAFGVQRVIKVKDIPRGTSVIAQEFSPGRPEPTPLNVVRQMAALEIDPLLKVEDKTRETAASAESAADILKKEISDGKVEMETVDQKIVIRILEEGSFTSGSDILEEDFLPVIQKISRVLIDTPGRVTIAGHTDDIPINTDRFRSNWDLSAARAVSVVQEILKEQQLAANRFEVSGLADTKPLMPNDSDKNRAKNRRVELIVEQGDEYSDYEDEVIGITNEEEAALLPGAELQEELLEDDEFEAPEDTNLLDEKPEAPLNEPLTDDVVFEPKATEFSPWPTMKELKLLEELSGPIEEVIEDTTDVDEENTVQ